MQTGVTVNDIRQAQIVGASSKSTTGRHSDPSSFSGTVKGNRERRDGRNCEFHFTHAPITHLHSDSCCSLGTGLDGLSRLPYPLLMSLYHRATSVN